MIKELSIIIVNWNTRDLLSACLESIAVDRQLMHNAIVTDTEVIVVDNASSDGSAAMVESRFPWVSLVQNTENMGFARGNNQAISKSTGRYVLLLNSDAQLSRGVTDSMIRLADRYPEIGVVGPRLVDDEGNLQQSWANFPTLWSEMLGVHHRSFRASVSELAFAVDWLAGACLLVKRSMINEVGLMDERFFLYSEETDWCRRVHDAGWLTVYYPRVTAVHREGSSSSQNVGASRLLLYQSKVLYASKHFGDLQARFLQLFFVVSGPLRALSALTHGRMQDARLHLAVSVKLLLLDI